MQTNTTEDIALIVAGNRYTGWTDIRLERRIDRMTTRFAASVVTGLSTFKPAWSIDPFTSFMLKAGKDHLLTGYLDDYAADLSGKNHSIRVSGRSKTEDLIDCTPDIRSGQFKGYTLEQIARSICQLYGIGVIVQTPATQVFLDATLQRGETAFAFLERMARLSSVLLIDDEQGNLVLTMAGNSRAAGRLEQGVNIKRGSLKQDVRKRFSEYIVKGQHPIGSAAANAGGLNGLGNPSPTSVAPVITNQRAVATDTGVPRYRPMVLMAEAVLDQAGMQARANWERNFAYGRSVEVEITVVGWRQPDGNLWRLNELVSVSAPWLRVDQDLLIVGVDFSLSNSTGFETTLKLGPIEGYTPDPGQVKMHARKGKAGTAPALNGLGVGG